MTSLRRFALSVSTVLAAAALVTGCVSTPGAPTSTSEPQPEQSQSTDAPHTGDDIEAAWLDGGRMFAVVTWGSSTCVPAAGEVTADGQTVTVALDEGDTDQACTDDLVPRASLATLPDGVDPTKDVELIVTLGDFTDDVDLDGSAAVAAGAAEYEPSAGWFDDEGIVLLTWGSSTCAPIVENVEADARTATVTFATEDRMCTMDMAPRATIISVGDLDDGDDDDADTDDDDKFTLTLVGDNLDGTVAVIEG